MAFWCSRPGNPKTVKAGDKAGSWPDRVNGQFVVTKIEKAGSSSHSIKQREEIMFRMLFYSQPRACVLHHNLAHVALEKRASGRGSRYKGSAAGLARLRRLADHDHPSAHSGRHPCREADAQGGWKLEFGHRAIREAAQPGNANIQRRRDRSCMVGGNLANAFYDEFVFTADIATDLKDGETIYFPVVSSVNAASIAGSTFRPDLPLRASRTRRRGAHNPSQD